jgi:hypothetical protein
MVYKRKIKSIGKHFPDQFFFLSLPSLINHCQKAPSLYISQETNPKMSIKFKLPGNTRGNSPPTLQSSRVMPWSVLAETAISGFSHALV